MKKVPFDIKTGKCFDCNDNNFWLNFKDAVERSSSHEGCGIGFVLGDGISGIDLDNVVNKDGSLKDIAKDFINRMDSYAEYSVSGKGVHILYYGSLDDSLAKRRNISFSDGTNGTIEFYSQKRFFVVTGNCCNKTHLQNREQQAMDLYKKYIGLINREKIVSTTSPNTRYKIDTSFQSNVTMTDEEIWNKVKRQFERLNDYSDESTKDWWAVIFLKKYTHSPEQIERILRNFSGLARDKWNNSNNHDGIQGTYLTRTIYHALSSNGQRGKCTMDKNNYDDTLPITQYINSGTFDTEKSKAKSSVIAKSGFSNLDKYAKGIKAGLYILAGTPSVGKTTFALQLSQQIAEQQNTVIYIALEQSRLELTLKCLIHEYSKKHLCQKRKPSKF